jgi:hypothetical protein
MFNKLNFSYAFVSKQTMEKSWLYLPVQGVSALIYPQLSEVFVAFGSHEQPQEH